MTQLKRLFANVTAATWLHEHQRDLHLILKSMNRDDPSEPRFVCSMDKNLLPTVLGEWLQCELPNTPVGIVCKDVRNSKHYWESWFVPYLDFSPHGLERYVAVWEGADQRGRNAGFRRKTIKYSEWRAELSRLEVYAHARPCPATVIWFNTPIGLLWSPWNRFDDYAVAAYQKQMIWLRTQELFPALAHVQPGEMVRGTCMPDAWRAGAWFCSVSFPHDLSYKETLPLKAKYCGDGALLTADQRVLRDFLGVGDAPIWFEDRGWG